MDFNTLTTDDIMALKGAELKEAATELNIAGRSSMKASELREAIAAYWADRLYREAKDDEVTESFYDGEIFPADEFTPDEVRNMVRDGIFPADERFDEFGLAVDEFPSIQTENEMIAAANAELNDTQRKAAAKRQRKAALRVMLKNRTNN